MKNFGKKSIACLLAIILFAGVITLAPSYQRAFAASVDKVIASHTEIAVGSTVVIKKGAVDNEDSKEINGFFRLFEYTVKSVENNTATVEYLLSGSVLQEYGITADVFIDLVGMDRSNTAAITAFKIGYALVSAFSWPLTYVVDFDSLSLVKGGINSTKEELKYIGLEAYIKPDALDADGNEIASFWTGLIYDITSVTDDVAHLQCRLSASKIQDLGITKETFANMIGIDPANKYFSAIYNAVMAAGYKVDFDVNLEDLTVLGLVDTESDTQTDTEPNIQTVVIARITVGDPDGDEEITMADVVLLQKAIAKLTVFSANKTKAADVDGDTKLTMLDVTTIQKYVAKLITIFPAGNLIQITTDTEVVDEPEPDTDSSTKPIVKPRL